MDVANVLWLGSPEAQEMLATLPPYAEESALASVARLRRQGVPAERAAALVTQQRLRERAKGKFGPQASRMLFTAEGLEQATRREIAEHHAARFASAPLSRVYDLGCGIGADAMALAARGLIVAAIDADPVTAAVADSNLSPWAGSRAQVGRAEDFLGDDALKDDVLTEGVVTEDVLAPTGGGRGRVGAWLDPARRTPGVADISGRTRRVFRLGDLSPAWETVLGIAASIPATGVKLSPSFPHDRVPPGTEAQWVSRAGELLECTIWWGPLVRTSGRTALIVRAGSPAVEVTQEQASAVAPALASPAGLGPWLYECDRALTQAGLVGAVIAATDGREIEPGLGLVTAGAAYDLEFARRYALREVLPLSAKPIRAWLRANGITGLTLKKRGVRLDDDALRRQLRIGRGAGSGESATLLLTRVAGRQSALVLDPA